MKQWIENLKNNRNFAYFFRTVLIVLSFYSAYYLSVLLVILPFMFIYIADIVFDVQLAQNTVLQSYIGETALAAIFMVYSDILVFKKEYKIPDKDKKLTAFPTICIYLSCVFLATALNIAAFFVMELFGINPSGGVDFSGFTRIEDVLMAVLVSVIGPVTEEYVFRHVLLGKLRFLGVRKAVFISAAVFASLHGTSGMAYAFVFGIALGYVALSRGIHYSSAIHIINNSVSSILALAEKYVNEDLHNMLSGEYILLIFIGGIISICVITAKSIKQKNENRKD